MSWLAQLSHVAVVTAALLTSGGDPNSYDSSLEGPASQQASELRRVLALMAPLARQVSASANRDELEANIDEQLFSGLFSDLTSKSVESLLGRSDAERRSDLDEQFLSRVEDLGGSRSVAEDALVLSRISWLLSHALVQSFLQAADEREILADLEQFNLREFLYDIQIPLEVRQGVQADAESAICVVTLAWAVGAGERPEPWLVAELVERWHSGRENALLMLLAMAREAGIQMDEALPDELQVRLGLLALDGAVPDLQAGRQRSESMARNLRTIAEHANRQIDGVWPKR